MIPRLILLTAMAGSLSSCGIARNVIGSATGLLGGTVSGLTGAVRLADTPGDAAAPPAARPQAADAADKDEPRTP